MSWASFISEDATKILDQVKVGEKSLAFLVGFAGRSISRTLYPVPAETQRLDRYYVRRRDRRSD